MDAVLCDLVTAELTHAEYLFDFPLLLTFDKVRRRSREIGAVFGGFSVRGQVSGVKNIMYFPAWRELELVGGQGDNCDDLEGAVMFWCKFSGRVLDG